MRYALFIFAGVATLAAGMGAAAAGSTSIGGNFTTERDPDDFNATTGSDWQADINHIFDNKVNITAAAKYYDNADTSDYKVNVQFAVGYTVDIGKLSLNTAVGVGQHFIHSDDDVNFPYYYITLTGTVPITDKWSWTIFRVRYRNAFDTSNGYETPEVATGVSYSFDAHNSVTLFIERDWSNGAPNYNGIEIGYRYRF